MASTPGLVVTPVAAESSSPAVPPAAPSPDPGGVKLDGPGDNVAEDPNVRTLVIPHVVIKNPSPPASLAVPSLDPVNGVLIEGLDIGNPKLAQGMLHPLR